MVAADIVLVRSADPDLSERRFVAYAWPVKYESSGQLTFAVGASGEVRGTDCPWYSGRNGPRPGAALVSGGLSRVTGRLATDAAGQDGNVWRKDWSSLYR